MKIFVLGMPGSGKTTLGRSLARLKAVAFVDLDEQIERESGKIVRQIFDEQGESAFRKLEARVLREWCTREQDFVMATGGGTPCFADNIQVINRSGLSLFLDVNPDMITERLRKTDLTTRPLFANVKAEDLKKKIEEMRSQRVSFYHLAHVRLSAEMSAEDILTVIDTAKRK